MVAARMDRRQQELQNYALAEAAAHGDLLRVEATLDMGADANCRYQGFTPLYLAAMKDHHRVVQCLLRRGARTEVVCNKRRTAIMIAASRGRLKTVEVLLAFKANVDVKDERGATAWHLAVRNGHEGVAEMLRVAQKVISVPRTTLLLSKLRTSSPA
ncbi:Aste57867_15466 [Aphanomyces stellatus]|uniref:Aste57867_15466 protein n=1 Tax=Aphanomyces stellatus TaxID=120398 RepID=A0A485L520_9STRA|nr:hypothetical protein As57867_015410 [Aphanomyces stellatus]VFT92268.1 Aste57867_15466 [Aphanomyces stellatus]